jgi:hypothetical protein
VAGGFGFGGGGIAITSDGPVTISDCTISANSADVSGGGGIAIAVDGTGPVTVSDCTISGNSADSSGGGIEGRATIWNTITAANTAPAGPDVSGFLLSQGHNLIGDGTGGSGFMASDLVGTSSDPIDPKLGPLQDNGGPTQTMAPLPSSPAIDAGDPTNTPPTDQRGLPRVLGGMTDIGAVELRVFHVTRFC